MNNPIARYSNRLGRTSASRYADRCDAEQQHRHGPEDHDVELSRSHASNWSSSGPTRTSASRRSTSISYQFDTEGTQKRKRGGRQPGKRGLAVAQQVRQVHSGDQMAQRTLDRVFGGGPRIRCRLDRQGWVDNTSTLTTRRTSTPSRVRAVALSGSIDTQSGPHRPRGRSGQAHRRGRALSDGRTASVSSPRMTGRRPCGLRGDSRTNCERHELGKGQVTGVRRPRGAFLNRQV
jgi:hypothetical protein